MSILRPGPGRPPKYGRPSRAVTVTLPEDVLTRLSHVNTDLGRAIVTVSERHSPNRLPAIRPAELASYGNHAVIVVTPVDALRKLAGVQLVPIGDGRALISLEHPGSIARLELDVRDAIDSVEAGGDRDALEALADILRRSRGSRRVSLQERTIIVLEQRRRPEAIKNSVRR